MPPRGAIAALLLAVTVVSASPATTIPGLHTDLEHINQGLHGRVIDHTNNHGSDNRIWSAALQQRRDLYVYVPPDYDPSQRYPLLLYLHGWCQDEQYFIENQVQMFDRAIAEGRLPPLIIAVPDGSIQGKPSFYNSASFFVNSRAGNFEDFLMQDVWSFVLEHYPIRPERQAHVLGGASMGGSAAFNLGIKYRDRFGMLIGFFPPLNLRWVDTHGHYWGNFDPARWGWRTEIRPSEVVGRFYGVVTVRFRVLIDPLFGHEPEALEDVSRINPIEVLDRTPLKEGELPMYVAYGGKDQFNVEAQVESFLYAAKQRGLTVGVGYDPDGRHDLRTGIKLFPGAVAWAAPLLAPYSPSPRTAASHPGP